MRIKMKGDSRSPWKNPLEVEKVEEGVPLTKMEKKENEVKDRIHFTLVGENPKAWRICWI
jgi:hypothetical protein